MKVQVEVEEARELLACVLSHVLETDLGDADRTALRKWSTKMTPGSEGMRELLDKLNADMARALVNKKRSAVRKPDWR